MIVTNSLLSLRSGTTCIASQAGGPDVEHHIWSYLQDRAPLGAVRRFADAVALITETIEEPGASAINEVVHTMLGHISLLDDLHSALFRLHHPNREQFERDGWPDDKPEEINRTGAGTVLAFAD